MPRPMITVSEGLCNAASASECACQPDPAVDDAAVQAYYKAHQAELKCEHASGLCVRVAILPPSVMALLASWAVKGAISPHTCEEA